MARPTKYNDKVVAQARSYLNTWEEDGDMIPSVEGLALNLKLARQTLYNWGDEYPEFLDILEDINIIQKKTLINKGLSGDFNSNITKLVLGKHGFSDRQELSGIDGKDLIPSQIITSYE